MSSENRMADEVRAEIEQTRADLGETAAALVDKADVKARLTRASAAKTAEIKQAVGEKAADVRRATKETTATVKQAATERVAQAEQATARATVAATEAGVQAADSVRHQFTDGDVADVARRPVPRALIGAAVLGVVGIVLVKRRRRR